MRPSPRYSEAFQHASRNNQLQSASPLAELFALMIIHCQSRSFLSKIVPGKVDISVRGKLLLLGLILALARLRAGAQGFDLAVTGSANPATVNLPLTYTITVSNLTPFILPDTFVTNAIPASSTFLGATNSQGNAFRSGRVVLFSLGQFNPGTMARMAVTISPTVIGLITNEVYVASTAVTNTAATNVVTEVIAGRADLQVRFANVPSEVTVNDLMSYSLIATNAGSNDVPGVVLTNTLPPDVLLLKVAPANQAYTFTNQNLTFQLGLLTNRATRTFTFTVQPTNAGVLTFAASIHASDFLDPDPTNNTASTNITVINYLPGELTAVTNSAQAFNLQNGYMEQSVLLSNVGTNDIASARVIVSGLSNRLVNAVGTNSGSPFVVYNNTLVIGDSVNLLLQYFASNRVAFPFDDSQLQAREVPLVKFAPPASASTSTNHNISRLVTLTNGNVLLEFPSVAGKTYSVVYSDNVLFSNAQLAPPAIVAPANRSQWIDYGPPTTMSAPMNSTSRFYRIILNP
jgi:uncharacterized repeat protein (TIGR01451 family)